MADTPDLATSCRPVTPYEVAHLARHGWVKLDALISADAAAYLLARTKSAMGETGDADPKASAFGYFLTKDLKALEDDALRPLVVALSNRAKALINRGDAIRARYLASGALAKLPEGGGDARWGSLRTEFHQDFQVATMDRAGSVVFWIALDDLGPETGTMCFLDGSHQAGPLGSVKTRKGDITIVYPELAKQHPVTPQMSYRPGDATVHLDLCVHGGFANVSDKTRFSFGASFVPSDVCWTGAPIPGQPEATAEMTPWRELDERWFPILSD